MAARMKSKATPKYKTKYRVKNWRAYEESLRKRGDITVWFDQDAVEAWNAPSSGRPGGQRRYSNLAIVTALTLRTVFHLGLRQTEGFVVSLIRLMGLDLRTPDHTTLSRRNGSVLVSQVPKTQDGPIHLVIDTTGLKMVGDGEWHEHKHKTSNWRRSWRKLHIGVDGEGFIVATRLTESGATDASAGVEMIKQLEASIERFTADGAYDTRAIYEMLSAVGEPELEVVIPPRRTAASSKATETVLEQRDAANVRITEVGRRQWRKESGAHQQARGENAMFRYKRIVGDRLRAKRFRAQRREAMKRGERDQPDDPARDARFLCPCRVRSPDRGTDLAIRRAMQQRPRTPLAAFAAQH